MRLRGPPLETRHVPTLRDLDQDRVVTPGQQVIALERAPEAPCLDPDDRIVLDIEIRVAAENFNRD